MTLKGIVLCILAIIGIWALRELFKKPQDNSKNVKFSVFGWWTDNKVNSYIEEKIAEEDREEVHTILEKVNLARKQAVDELNAISRSATASEYLVNNSYRAALILDQQEVDSQEGVKKVETGKSADAAIMAALLEKVEKMEAQLNNKQGGEPK